MQQSTGDELVYFDSTKLKMTDQKPLANLNAFSELDFGN